MSDTNWKTFFEGITSNIHKYGQSLVGVPHEVGLFMYTIGNHELGLPELLLIGDVRPEQAQRILNALGLKQRDQAAPLLGDVPLGESSRFPLRLREISYPLVVRDDFTCQVENYYKTRDYKVTQVLIPDTEGRFPGESGCAEPYCRCPLV